MTDDVVLAPRFWLPLAVVVLGLAVLPLSWLWGPALWPGLVLSLFGLFLLVQSALLRLVFSDDALLVWRQETLLRRFPYSDWLGWRLFWPAVPVLFYFRRAFTCCRCCSMQRPCANSSRRGCPSSGRPTDAHA
jgi:hypothetical protein